MITPHSTEHGLSLSASAAAVGLGSDLRVITVDGNRVAYRDEGAGEVLLLIHGLGANSSSWRAVLPKLATEYRVITPDLPGHGLSDPLPGEHSPAAFADWLRDLLDALGIPAVTVVGHSFGGGLAMQFADQHRDYCRRLVLLSSGGLGREVIPMLRLLSLPGAGLVLALLVRGRQAGADNHEGKVGGETSTVRQSLANPRNRKAILDTLRCVVDRRGQKVCALDRLGVLADLPTQIIFGASDAVIPVAHAYAAHQRLPSSRLHVLPGVGHSPQVDSPDVVVELIDEFVSQSSRDALVPAA
jgi:pimeloyl-ACP methyl ester carboxylesterase